MLFDWVQFREKHPRCFATLVMLKGIRTQIALLLASYCVIEGIYCAERPFDIDEYSPWVFVAMAMILAGVAFRFAALGCIRKHEQLATTGVYSLCRHPLYLGSLIITYGFCVLLRDAASFVLATAYFATFYPLTIAWEEVRLYQQYGAAHRRYYSVSESCEFFFDRAATVRERFSATDGTASSRARLGKNANCAKHYTIGNPRHFFCHSGGFSQALSIGQEPSPAEVLRWSYS